MRGPAQEHGPQRPVPARTGHQKVDAGTLLRQRLEPPRAVLNRGAVVVEVERIENSTMVGV
jgi:hypothetical protein